MHETESLVSKRQFVLVHLSNIVTIYTCLNQSCHAASLRVLVANQCPSGHLQFPNYHHCLGHH